MSGERPACAACKFRKTLCSEETCILYPYFPAERKEDFLAVNKYFGFSKLKKNIQKLAVEERRSAVESFVWAAMAWELNPNTGPLFLYTNLSQEYQRTVQENQRLQQQIEVLMASANQGMERNLEDE